MRLLRSSLLAALALTPVTAASARPDPVVSGILTAPSTDAPSKIARDHVAALAGVDPARLREVDVRPAGGGGSIVRLQQVHAGLDVVGAGVAVRVDARGRVRWVGSTAVTLPDDLDLTTTVDAAGAIVRAGGGARLDATHHARRVIWAPPGAEPRPAWKVVLPRDLARVEVMLRYVDARTGRILSTENLVKTDRRANVFPQNPVRTPDTAEVTLAIPASSTQLDGPDLLGRSCIDRGNCIPVDFGGTTFNIHMCDFEAHAFADGSGDFLYTRPATDTEPEDEFAEVQIYHHATLIYAYFRGFGLTNLNAHPMQVLANFRVPQLDASSICAGTTSDGPLYPFDNAAFVPEGGLLPGFPADDMLIFGQGTGADLSYEGDVIYHEMGHALASAVNTLGFVVPDELGLDTTPGGMSEGYADYFAGAYTEDPAIGEYSGPSLGLDGPIRDMDNADTCPRSLTGEVHADSLPWTGALWEIRASLDAADRPAFDQAVYDAFATITETDVMLSVAAKTLAEIEAAMGADTRAAAEAIFAARGFDDCDDRVILFTGAAHPLLNLYGTDQIDAGTVPGPVQFQLVLDEDASEIQVDIGAWQAAGAGGIGGGADPGVTLLIKAGDEPIHWTWGATATHDADQSGAIALAANGAASSGSVEGSFPAGTYTVMLANTGASAYLQDVMLSYTPGSAGEPDAGAGDAPDAGGTGGDDDDSGGCCDSGGGSGAPLGGIGLAALVLGAVRRRRRRA